MITYPLEIYNSLPEKTFFSLSEATKEDLVYGDVSSYGSNSCIFGTSDPHKLIFYEAASILKLKFQKSLRKKLIIARIRVNGSVGGQEADWHVDSSVEGTWASVVYTSPVWDPIFSGSTVIHNPQTNFYTASVYLPNKAIIFPATWDHAITTTTLKKNCFRTSLGVMFVEPHALPKLLENNPLLEVYLRRWG